MLEEMRKKPAGVKKLYAFWGAAGTTGLIAVVWVLALVMRFPGQDLFSTENVAESTGAFSQFFERTKDETAEIIKNSNNKEAETSQSGSLTASTSPATTTKDGQGSESSSAGRTVQIATTSVRSTQ